MPTSSCNDCHTLIASNPSEAKVVAAAQAHSKATGHRNFYLRQNAWKWIWVKSDGSVVVTQEWG